MTLAGGTLASATVVAGDVFNVTVSSTLQAVTLQSSSVNVTAGKLSLTSGGSSTGASFSISSGAILGFDGSYSLDSTSSVTGAGTGEFGSGTVNFQTNQTNYNVTRPDRGRRHGHLRHRQHRQRHVERGWRRSHLNAGSVAAVGTVAVGNGTLNFSTDYSGHDHHTQPDE